MIPYFQLPALQLGPLTVTSFGVLAAAGVMLATQVTLAVARRDGLDPRVLVDYAPWGLGAGVLAGHWVHLFLYHPEELANGPLQIFRFWEGLSSFGGLLGGVVAAAVFFRRQGASFRAYSDALALGVAPGWGVARLGCFSIHDHPGVLSDFILAVRFPGGARHDLGLYDALLLLVAAGVLALLRKKGWATGRLLPVLALIYGIGRFGLDFLRARDLPYVDARYLGLTPAQYACIALVAYGLLHVRRAAPMGHTPAAGPPRSIPE